jgi:hypothetical protein
VAVVEVERLWFRFKQLGADKNGYISKKLLEKGELGQDAFVKNVNVFFMIQNKKIV